MEKSFSVRICFLRGNICRERSARTRLRRWALGWISKPRRKVSGRTAVVYLSIPAFMIEDAGYK